MTPALVKNHQALLAAAKEGVVEAKGAELARVFGVKSPRAARRIVSQLEREGVIRRENSGGGRGLVTRLAVAVNPDQKEDQNPDQKEDREGGRGVGLTASQAVRNGEQQLQHLSTNKEETTTAAASSRTDGNPDQKEDMRSVRVFESLTSSVLALVAVLQAQGNPGAVMTPRSMPLSVPVAFSHPANYAGPIEHAPLAPDENEPEIKAARFLSDAAGLNQIQFEFFVGKIRSYPFDQRRRAMQETIRQLQEGSKLNDPTRYALKLAAEGAGFEGGPWETFKGLAQALKKVEEAAERKRRDAEMWAKVGPTLARDKAESDRRLAEFTRQKQERLARLANG